MLKTFCRVVGKDAMEYPDFEFWYYRFYQGELHLDYDRSADPEPKKLVDMPVVLMKEIVKNLDAVESMGLEPVLEIEQSEFFKEESGCTLYRENISKFEESEECYIKKSLECFTPLLTMPNIQVNHFSLRLHEESIETISCDDLLPVALNAKNVVIEGQTTNQVVKFLSTMNPGSLESIRLNILCSGEMENYGTILEIEQFKQAKNVDFDTTMKFNVEDLVHFNHLKTFKFHLIGENTFEDVPRIRDIIPTSEKFESCELEYFSILDGFSIRKFARALGAEIPTGPLAENGRLTITHRYQIPESNESLEFKLNEVGFR
ncbi:hypothetical protein L3Y34_009619 [Caenorhabditis briggsae]|uniref:DUF38 domain-containing protein n=1 Tax=Caenorhabditis briggsae TaxID=6238 RepID=A0AAE9A7N2_CAEBR|nr:hypothetical protein L3Y34_009619 [Caenorhabditis briggsae]